MTSNFLFTLNLIIFNINFKIRNAEYTPLYQYTYNLNLSNQHFDNYQTHMQCLKAKQLI